MAIRREIAIWVIGNHEAEIILPLQKSSVIFLQFNQKLNNNIG